MQQKGILMSKKKTGKRYTEEQIIRILDELSRLRELEEENRRLKKIVAQQVLDIDALKDLLTKKW